MAGSITEARRDLFTGRDMTTDSISTKARSVKYVTTITSTGNGKDLERGIAKEVSTNGHR
jgi:hypothetical protein